MTGNQKIQLCTLLLMAANKGKHRIYSGAFLFVRGMGKMDKNINDQVQDILDTAQKSLEKLDGMINTFANIHKKLDRMIARMDDDLPNR